MSRSRLNFASILFLAICFFLIFHERELSGFDPGSFALAIKYGYSVDAMRPHPPGYPGFYLLWIAIEYLTGLPAHGVLVLANIGFAILALSLTYWAAKRLFDGRTATVASLLALSNLLFLYYGCVGELYEYDAAFSGFLVVLLLVPPKRAEPFLYLLYGLLGSFRLSSVVLTLPVVVIVLGIRFYRTKVILPVLRDFLAVVIGTVLWLVPFVVYLGGWQHFARIVQEASHLPGTVVQNLAVFAGTTLWLLGVPGLLALAKARRFRFRRWDERYAVLLLVVIVPASFFAFRYMAKGYELLFLAPLCILLARSVRGTGRATIGYAVAANLLLFFFVPFIAPSLRSVLNHRHRSARERMESAVLRHLSVFAPTLAHISTSDLATEDANGLLKSVRPDATVFVDNSAAFWAFPRSLQFAFPKMKFLMSLAQDSADVRCFSGADMNDDMPWASLANLPLLYYISDSEMALEIGPPPGNCLQREGHLALYGIPQDSLSAAHSYIDRFFIIARK